MCRIALYGAGGLGRLASDVCLSNKNIKLVGFIDDERREEVFGFPILGKWEDLNFLIESSKLDAVTIALGDGYSARRLEAFESLRVLNLTSIPIVHSSSVISKHASIGEGSLVMSLTSVGPDVTIGCNCVIFSGCVLEHDDTIGDNVYISPGVKLCGYVSIGSNSYIGAGATICPDVKIGNNTTVGAGAVVIRDVPDNTVVAGVPAKILKTKPSLTYY